jgi:glycosyltransferase involved in cell wall biosynthesis
MAQFDIGVLPLDDTPFEQAKFPIKLLQYFALGVPAVASPVGMPDRLVQHGHNGLLAGSPAEWRDHLEALIVDRALRQRLAAAGQATVESYSLERVGPLLADGLIRAAA